MKVKDFLKNYIFSNWALKLSSLILAILVWCMIMNKSDPYVTRTINNVPVSKINEDAVTDENMIYDVTSGDTISVTLYGPRSSINEIGLDNIIAYADLKELSITNSCPIHIDFNDVEDEKNIEIVDKSRDVIMVSLEEMVSQDKQVVCGLTGTCATGYYATVEISPNTIEVFGSANAVEQIQNLYGSVDITDKSESFTTEVDVVPYNSDGQEITNADVTYEQTKVNVIVKMLRTKNVNIVIDADVSAGYGFVLDDLKFAPTSVTIAGAYENISTITEIKIPYENKNLLETVNDNIQIADYLPDGCYLVSGVSDVISITVPVLPLIENRTISVPFKQLTVSGLSDSLVVSSNPENVSVSFWGAEGTTTSLTTSDLKLGIDYSGITEPGDYYVNIISSNNDIMIDQTQIKVTLTAKE